MTELPFRKLPFNAAEMEIFEADVKRRAAEDGISEDEARIRKGQVAQHVFPEGFPRRWVRLSWDVRAVDTRDSFGAATTSIKQSFVVDVDGAKYDYGSFEAALDAFKNMEKKYIMEIAASALQWDKP